MIYKIEHKDFPKVFERGGRVMLISADTQYILATKLNDVEGLAVVETYDDSQFRELSALPFWRQPT